MALGIARGTMDAFLALPREKTRRGAGKPMVENNVVQSHVAQSEARWRSARYFLHAAADEALETIEERGEMDLDHNLVITKSRCSEMADKVIKHPGPEVGDALLKWLNDGAEPVVAVPSLATAEQVREIKDLLGIVRLPDGTVDKWFAKAGVDLWEDMPADAVAKCIDYVKGRLPGTRAA